MVLAGIGGALLSLLVAPPPSGSCGSASAGPAAAIVLGPPGTGARVGATEYGGPGDPSSGDVGASGVNLLAHPDSYAELGGYTFQTATAMGGLPYMTPLRITWAAHPDHSAIAYKRDFGFGGPPVAGLPRVIDLWWEFASRPRDSVRARALVGAGADRAPARDGRVEPARPGRRRRSADAANCPAGAAWRGCR